MLLLDKKGFETHDRQDKEVLIYVHSTCRQTEEIQFIFEAFIYLYIAPFLRSQGTFMNDVTQAGLGEGALE